MGAANNGLVIEAEVVINQVTFDVGLTTDNVPEIVVRVFKELTEYVTDLKFTQLRPRQDED